MTGQLLARARAGDGDAFAELVEPFRPELQVHCYRILGSVADAEDALQETLMAAWRGLDQFEGRSSVRAWLYRIATNKSLNTLRADRTRPRPEPARPLPKPTLSGEPLWLEPYPDISLGELPDSAPGPEARYEARESVSLAFLAALQHLPPMQRAALILRDVLGFRAAEAAGTLECSVDTVNGLLKRARAGLTRQLPPGGRDRAPLPGSAREREVVARFTDSYERGDTAAIVALLTDDATLTMPPLPFEYHGRVAVAGFLTAICGTRLFRLIPTRANGQPAFGCYLRDDTAPIARAHGLLVLTLTGDHITAITRFLDNSVLPPFGLPRVLPGQGFPWNPSGRTRSRMQIAVRPGLAIPAPGDGFACYTIGSAQPH
jgi:RNA polymerase sigma-70 factor (TIGR02960 family)